MYGSWRAIRSHSLGLILPVGRNGRLVIFLDFVAIPEKCLVGISYSLRDAWSVVFISALCVFGLCGVYVGGLGASRGSSRPGWEACWGGVGASVVWEELESFIRSCGLVGLSVAFLQVCGAPCRFGWSSVVDSPCPSRVGGVVGRELNRPLGDYGPFTWYAFGAACLVCSLNHMVCICWTLGSGAC